MSTPRMIYVFAYILIADMLYIICNIFFNKIDYNNINLAIFLVIMLSGGLVVHLLWQYGVAYIEVLSYVLSFIVFVSFIFLIFSKKTWIESAALHSFGCSVIAIGIFFVPILGKEFSAGIAKLFRGGRPSVEWFKDNNPLGFSMRLIEYVRSIGPGKTFLVNPVGKAFIPLYAPHYVAVVPNVIGTVIMDRAVYREVRGNKHPLYNFQSSELSNEIREGSVGAYQESDFSQLKGRTTLNGQELIKSLGFIALEKVRGDFEFSHIVDGGGNAVRISPVGKKNRKPFVQLGYTQGGEPFDVGVFGGLEVAFVISARSSRQPLKRAPYLFIEDRTTKWERNGVIIDKSSWNEFMVSKVIRPEASGIRFVIKWRPVNESDWLEIRNMKIYVFPNSRQRYLRVDHGRVKDWLNAYSVDYILIRNQFYEELLPYFHRYSDDYKVVFNNQSKREFVVQYLRE
jgi:hypothetical protein